MSTNEVDVHCGTMRIAAFPPHTHDTYSIGVVERGVARITYRGRATDVGPNDIFAISPNEAHSGVLLTPHGWSYRVMHLPAAVVAAASDQDADGPFFGSVIVQASTDLPREVAAVHEELLSGRIDTKVEDRLMSMLNRIATCHSSDEPREPVADHRWSTVRHLCGYIDAHLDKPVRLAELSDLSGFSSFHLVRLFARVTGMTPHAYLIQARLRHGQSLLRLGVSVSTVAHACGFSDQAHLTRFYKRAFGLTPGAYLRAVQSGAASAGRRAVLS